MLVLVYFTSSRGGWLGTLAALIPGVSACAGQSCIDAARLAVAAGALVGAGGIGAGRHTGRGIGRRFTGYASPSTLHMRKAILPARLHLGSCDGYV